jgi:hypothetical protein
VAAARGAWSLGAGAPTRSTTLACSDCPSAASQNNSSIYLFDYLHGDILPGKENNVRLSPGIAAKRVDFGDRQNTGNFGSKEIDLVIDLVVRMIE